MMMKSKFLKLPTLRSLQNVKKANCSVLTISVLFHSSKATETRITDYLTKEHKLSHETAVRVSQCLSHVKSPETFDPVLSFLKHFGFSQTHIEKIVKSLPRVLLADTQNTLKPKISSLQDLGFGHDDIVDIIRRDPFVLFRSAGNRIVPSIYVLMGVLGSVQSVAKLLKVCGSFLKFDLEKTMLPNIELLKECGIGMEQIARYITHFPRFFLNKPEVIKSLICRTEEMGIDRKCMTFLPGMRVLSSMSKETWESKITVFRGLGFSENDIAKTFVRTPQVFSLSESKIKNGVRVLLTVRDIDISYIVNRPEILIYSVENRLKPRVEVFNILKEKNLLKGKISFVTFCRLTDQVFLEKYLTPHSKVLGEKMATEN